MVARINTPSSINRALNYNEQKVRNNQATLLHAEGFLKDAEQLNFHEKLNRFTHLIKLNDRAKTNSLHISLNFDSSDKLNTEKLVDISRKYMSSIGFSDQPYLVYQHHDSGHPHIHIVTTSIRPDGSRIDTYNIGRNQSEAARTKIEQEFGLKQANKSKQQESAFQFTNAARVQYGKAETKKAIQNVLTNVVNTYKYTSLAELNAVLKQYNVQADRGGENSRIYNNRGLVYRILDEQGNKVGVPIKASAIYNKPTLKHLEEKFAPNAIAREPGKVRVKNAVDLALFRRSNVKVEELVKTLKKEGISTVIRQNKEGIVYGLTYVDHTTKCVFNGSDLGKAYSAKGVMERFSQGANGSEERQDRVGRNEHTRVIDPGQAELLNSTRNKEAAGILETLTQPEQMSGYVPGQLTGSGRKRKKKRSRHL